MGAASCLATGAIGLLCSLAAGVGGTRNVSPASPPPTPSPSPSRENSSAVEGRAAPAAADTRGVPAIEGVADAARGAELEAFLRLGTNLVVDLSVGDHASAWAVQLQPAVLNHSLIRPAVDMAGEADQGKRAGGDQEPNKGGARPLALLPSTDLQNIRLGMVSPQVILTVGSTRFDSLVTTFLSSASLDALASLGISTASAQVGASRLPTGWKEGLNASSHGVQVEIVRFASDLEDRVGRAGLVVSHAGEQRCSNPDSVIR